MKDLIITSLETITAFDPASGDFLFVLDELQNASIANTEEKVDITGKQGRKLSSLKRNKGVTISGANGLLSGGLMELQSGGTFENKTTKVMWTDYLSVSSNAATTSFKAVGTSGAEIRGLYVRNADGSLGDELTQAGTAASGKFTYTPNTKALAFSGLSDGTEIVVYYERQITADVLANESDKYSKKAMLYIDAIGEDRCANVYHIQFFIPKADFNGEYSIDLGDDQVVQNFEAEALAGACGVAGVLWTYTVFGENAADAA
jgi:hypothetical protein